MRLTITHISGLKKGEREIFTSFPITIGRAPGASLRLAANDTRASTRHAEVIVEGSNLVLRDLNSTNGTYLKGKRIDRIKLVNAEVIEFGVDGPKLLFEIAFEEVAAGPPPLAGGPPPLAVQPANSSGNSPQFGIANQGPGIQLAVSPATPTPAVAPISMPPMAIEEREFQYRNRFKFILFGIGGILMIVALTLFYQNILVWSIPIGLIGLFLFMMGWSCSRINITASSQGLHYQGILRSTMIRWEDITELRGFRSRTRLLTDLVYEVRSNRKRIVFAAEDYQDGLDLATLVARRTRLKW
ncbi:MAG: FHA domain-containing protein [Acidobacteriota bacterium]